jgi:type I restriction enzyme S subunit
LCSGFASGQREDDGIVQLRMNNITLDGQFDFSEILKVPIPADIEKFDLQKGDILFNNTNSLDLIGKTAIVKEKLRYTFSNHLTRIRTRHNKVLPYWLYLIFLRYQQRAVFRSICNTHVGQSGIGKKELQKLPIYFPATTEQQNIASILSNVDSLTQQTQKIVEQTQRLKKGLMQQLLTKGIGHTRFKKVKWLFGQETEIPHEWKITELNHVSQITDSLHITPKYSMTGIPMVRSTDIKYGDLKLEKALRVSKEVYENFIRKHKPQRNDIVMSRVGTYFVTSFVNTDELFCMGQNTLVIHPKINPLFLYFSLNSVFINKQIESSFDRTAGQKTMSLKNIKRLRIFLPTLIEQERIASILRTTDSTIMNLESKKSYLEKLKKGLMQKLLTGQIRVKV